MDSVFKALLTAGCLLLLTGQDVRGDNPAFCTGGALMQQKFKDECDYTMPASGSPHITHTREELCPNTAKVAEVAGCVRAIFWRCEGDKFSLDRFMLPRKGQAKALYDAMCKDEEIKFDCINDVSSPAVREAVPECKDLEETRNECFDGLFSWMTTCDNFTAQQTRSELPFMKQEVWNHASGAPTVSLALLLAALLAWAGHSV